LHCCAFLPALVAAPPLVASNTLPWRCCRHGSRSCGCCCMTGFRTQFAVLAARHVPFPRRTLKTETPNRHLLLCDRSSRPPHLHSCATLLAACRYASSSTCSASGPITAQAVPTLPFTTSGCILAYRGELHSRHHFPIGSYELPLSNTTAACRCPSCRPHVLISLSSLIAHRASWP
jgi:hypothetical protein